jgi:hypothetical protein
MFLQSKAFISKNVLLANNLSPDTIYCVFPWTASFMSKQMMIKIMSEYQIEQKMDLLRPIERLRKHDK